MTDINTTFAALCPAVDAAYVSDVLAPVGTDLTDSQVNQRINMAYFATHQVVGSLGDCGGNTAYCEIAALVAAHFVTMSERQTESENVAGEWRVKYMGKGELGLRASLYGQNAIAMDCSGFLANQANGVRRVSFSVRGRGDIANVDPPTVYYDSETDQ